MNNKTIIRAHGSGGRYTHDLIENIFVRYFANQPLAELADGALLDFPGGRLCFTTDSHVIRPLVYPGGDIGKLAVAGTVNDLAVCGAVPRWLSCGMIIEEGFSLAELEHIVLSMRKTADEAGVIIVTGDTKVVGKGEADGIFINTAGIGVVPEGADYSVKKVQPGDQVIVSGFIGDHEAVILAVRESFEISTQLISDCAVLSPMIQAVTGKVGGVRIMRDPTRGGLGTTLNEFATGQTWSIRLFENDIPVRESVKGLCEPLGFDPLYMANEGKVVMIVAPDKAAEAVQVMKTFQIGENAAVIGEIITEPAGRVLLKTIIGSERIIDMLSGEMLPRIC